MKAKEILLLSFFRSNARIPLTKISRETSIPVSTIFDKLKAFEGKVIQKHATLLDFRQLGYDLRVSLLLKAATDDKIRLQNYLLKEPCVNNLNKLTGRFDFLLECIFRDVNDLNTFNEKLDQFNITDKQEYFIVEDIKKEAFLTDKAFI